MNADGGHTLVLVGIHGSWWAYTGLELLNLTGSLREKGVYNSYTLAITKYA